MASYCLKAVNRLLLSMLMMPVKIADDDLVLQWLFSLYAIAFSLLLSFGGVFLKFPISPGLAPAGAGQVLQALCPMELNFFQAVHEFRFAPFYKAFQFLPSIIFTSSMVSSFCIATLTGCLGWDSSL